MARTREPRDDSPAVSMDDYPADPRLEASVLGACLSEGAHWWHAVETRTGREDAHSLFFDRQNSAVADAMQKARREHNDISMSYVEMNLSSSVGDDYFPNGIRPYLVSLQASTSISKLENLNGATTELIDLRSLRNILTDVEKTSKNILDGDLNSYDAAERLRGIASANATVKDVQTAKEILDSLDEEGVAPWRVSTGFKDMDKLVKGGFEPGRIYIIGARPKVGKTTFGLNSAMHVGVEEDVHVLFVSLEMNRAEIMGKMIASLSGVDHSQVTQVLNKEIDIETLGSEAKEEFYAAREDLVDSKISLAFADNTRNGAQDVVSMMLSMRARLGDGVPIVVYVDYAQLLVKNRYSMNNELDEIFRTLKLAAMELEIAIIAPSQVNREGGREGGMPEPYHLAASGSLEQHGDMICMLHRDSIDDPDAPKNIMDAHVALNRIGPSGHFKLNWVPEFSYIEDLEDHVSTARRSGGREQRRVAWDSDDEDDDY